MLRLDEPKPVRAVLPASGKGLSSAGRGGVQIVREHDEPLDGTMRTHQFGEVRVSLVKGGPGELVRPARQIDPQAAGFLRVCRPLTGSLWVVQDGRHAAVRAPQLLCYDSTRPYKVVMPEDYRLVDVMVTHRLVGLTAAEAGRLTARCWSGAEGLAALLSSLLEGLGRHGREVQTAVDLLGGSVVGLTAALFAERMREVADDPQIARQTLMLHIQAYVRRQLAEPGLSPVTIAREHNVSLRYLQKVFQEYGLSPARWIRDERLARCRAELADPALDHLPVALIGERAGLYGASHFSRLFRDRYGTTPRDYRRERDTR
ncbi:helix-turn-helix domain-containing protein [Streptomyces europaeiscabiei]|uniref:helix-turn-helix domain-containing protein n=1 Tax=Streptomyces europaeiscabiei TaxID=146819 RepID=UPI002E15AAF3|nr:helix-turn-helix domain-containing protein [Streptomyces europaeiscabiei]WSG28349.1 helix-turn-helix domain-containing protein [Streptomyces europaeiscabiei]